MAEFRNKPAGAPRQENGHFFAARQLQEVHKGRADYNEATREL